MNRSGKPAVRWIGAAGLCFLVSWLAGCDACGPSAGVDAGGGIRLSGVQGKVEVREAEGGDWRAVSGVVLLATLTAVRTGPDGRVEIALADGRQLRLGPGTELDLGTMADELDLELSEGELEVEPGQGGRGFRLIFGGEDEVMLVRGGGAKVRKLDGGLEVAAGQAGKAGFQVVFGDESSMALDREGRFQVRRGERGAQVQMVLGEATLTRQGRETPLAAGGGFRLQIGEGEVVAREALPTTLRDARRLAQLRLPNAKRFVRSGGKAVPVSPGTAIQTGAGSAELTDPAGGRLVLGPRSRALFEGAYRSDTGREGSLRLEQGEARVRLRRSGGNGATQQVVTPHGTVTASARGLTAEVTVRSQERSTEVLVHAGQAEVIAGGRKVSVPAGQRLTLSDPARPQVSTPLVVPRIRFREGGAARIFIDRNPPAVAFTWEASGAGPVWLEVARKTDFSELLLREPVAEQSFPYLGLARGRTFWRLQRPAEGGAKAGPVGVIEVEADPAAERRTGGVTSIVPDTGVQTRVIFQGEAPALTFQWQAVPEAAGYVVRLYRGEDLERPLLEKRATETRLPLPAGQLREGTYFWYQAALGADGKELRASQMNRLVLAFDNAATLVRIDSPRPGEAPRAGRVVVRGLAPGGSELSVNGQSIPIAPDGRFETTLSGIGSGSLLVFRLLKGIGGRDVYYTRQLGG